jgi:ATP-dependent Clp protease protease subunit
MREPLRVIEGTAKPYEPFWKILDAAGDQPVTIEFDGPISEYSWWGDEVTPKLFKDELYSKGKGGPVTCLVNSPGGEVVAASMIRSILQEYPGNVTCDIIGLCASAATIMVTGADQVRMRESALFMIHDPSAMAYGSVDELLSVVDILKTVKCSIVDTYVTKTGMDPAKIGKMMRDETWMSARQAREMGFVDEVVTGSTCKPKMGMRAGFLNCLMSFGNAPESLLEQVQEDGFYEDTPADGSNESAQPVIDAEMTAAIVDLRERIQSILLKR